MRQKQKTHKGNFSEGGIISLRINLFYSSRYIFRYTFVYKEINLLNHLPPLKKKKEKRKTNKLKNNNERQYKKKTFFCFMNL